MINFFIFFSIWVRNQKRLMCLWVFLFGDQSFLYFYIWLSLSMIVIRMVLQLFFFIMNVTFLQNGHMWYANCLVYSGLP